MFNTKLCQLLGIKYPIFQGGMAWVSTAELVAAVSEAGGLGIIGSGHAPADWVRAQIKRTKELTTKPFGINIMLRSPFVEDVMDVVLQEQVRVITTGAGNPGKYLEKLHEKGTFVIPLVASVALAKRLASRGVDAVIAEGAEAGGHVGDLTTMAFVPQVVDAIDIPVIAAGGIFDGRSLAAAMALGADGVQIGTRFIASRECQAHPRAKETILKARDRDTMLTGFSTGHPVRVIKNKFSRLLQSMEKEGTLVDNLEELGAGKLKAAMIDGDIEGGSIMAGQVSAMVKDIQSVEEIIEDIVLGASTVLKRLGVGGGE